MGRGEGEGLPAAEAPAAGAPALKPQAPEGPPPGAREGPPAAGRRASVMAGKAAGAGRRSRCGSSPRPPPTTLPLAYWPRLPRGGIPPRGRGCFDPAPPRGRRGVGPPAPPLPLPPPPDTHPPVTLRLGLHCRAATLRVSSRAPGPRPPAPGGRPARRGMSCSMAEVTNAEERTLCAA